MRATAPVDQEPQDALDVDDVAPDFDLPSGRDGRRLADLRGSPVKGAGEVGITGVAASLVNAVYHATGKRVRDLPIRLERLM